MSNTDGEDTQLQKGKFYWISIKQYDDGNQHAIRIADKWSVAQWDGNSFEEMNEMYSKEDVVKIGPLIPSPNDIEQIEKAAREYCEGSPHFLFEYRGYIAGATAQQKELASLREQLATEQDMRSTAEFANRMIMKDLNEKLKQKEDENRELKSALKDLISIVEYYHIRSVKYTDMPYKNWNTIIDKSKNLSA